MADEPKLPPDLLANPRERMADYIYQYVNHLRAYWCRHGIKDGKIHITTSPHLPGARDELVGTISGINVVVERQPKSLTVSIEVTKRDDGFNLRFGKSTVHVKGGPVHNWAEDLFQ